MGFLQRLDALTAPPPQPQPLPAPGMPDPVSMLQQQVQLLTRLTSKNGKGILDLLPLLRQIAANTARRADYDESLVLIPGENKPIRTQGYKHVMLWVPLASQSFTIELPTSNPTAITLALGWNILDCPDGTTITLPAGAANVNCGLHLTDTEPTGAIV